MPLNEIRTKTRVCTAPLCRHARILEAITRIHKMKLFVSVGCRYVSSLIRVFNSTYSDSKSKNDRCQKFQTDIENSDDNERGPHVAWTVRLQNLFVFSVEAAPGLLLALCDNRSIHMLGCSLNQRYFCGCPRRRTVELRYRQRRRADQLVTVRCRANGVDVDDTGHDFQSVPS